MPSLPGLRRYWHAFVVISAVCAGLLFLYARWSRRSAPLDDFGTVYGAARCWINGQNPYLGSEVSRAFHSAGGYPGVESGSPTTRPSVYFLPAMPIFATVAWLDWGSVHSVWIVLCCASFLAGIFVVGRQLPLPKSGQLLVGSVAIVLCKPFSTGMWFGNPSMLVIGIVIVSAGLAIRNRKVAAGVLLGLAVAIKPQLAIGLLAAFVIWRQWAALGTGAAVLAVATTVAALRAGSLSVLKLWLDTQRENLALSLAPGNINDPTLGSVYGYQFLNIQTLVGVFTANAAIGNAVAWLACAALILLYLTIRSRQPHPDLWTDFTFFTIVFLLPGYHRNYDGQFAIILLPWVVTVFRARRSPIAFFASLCVLPVLAGSFLWTLALFGSPSADGSVLRALALRHQALLVAGLGFLLAMRAYQPSPLPVEKRVGAAAA